MRVCERERERERERARARWLVCLVDLLRVWCAVGAYFSVPFRFLPPFFVLFLGPCGIGVFVCAHGPEHERLPLLCRASLRHSITRTYMQTHASRRALARAPCRCRATAAHLSACMPHRRSTMSTQSARAHVHANAHAEDRPLAHMRRHTHTHL